MASRTLEQQIAVFGLSGSGKTVLLSSFYGATQEPHYPRRDLFRVLADDMGQGTRLHQIYLGMKNRAQLPPANRFSATSYSFLIKLKAGANAKAVKAKPFDALRLRWHDYPGEWFEQDVSGPDEAARRVAAFRSLLGSDVAFLLVDAQKLLDHAGEEERYLTFVLTTLRNGLLSLKDDLLQDGTPLVQFPRIWVLALSKSDLLPDLDVYAFRDLLVEKTGQHIGDLREVLGGFVQASEALSVGEDFLLLSSAKFGADRIEVAQRVGLDLILPLAATLPFERHVKWSQAKKFGAEVGKNLLDNAPALAALLVKGTRGLPAPVALLLNLLAPKLVEAATLAGDRLNQVNAEALAKQDFLTATLSRFRMDLDQGEQERILLRSAR